MTPRPFTIALSGKGGTGKTTISSLLVRAFIDAGECPVLAVDADPNANFHEALGVEVKETLGSMREEAFTRNIPPGMNRHDYVRFRFRQALVESNGFDLVAMGRPEGTGCYCFANDLLSECMQQLEREYRFLVIDTEAGMEHISRGTIGKPDVLLIVSDPGARGSGRSPGYARSPPSSALNRHGSTSSTTGSSPALRRWISGANARSRSSRKTRQLRQRILRQHRSLKFPKTARPGVQSVISQENLLRWPMNGRTSKSKNR